MSGNSALGKNSLPNEADFHAAVVLGLSRAAHRLGRGALADTLGLTSQALGNIFAGAMPHAKRLFDALAADSDILDDLCELYGRKLVPLDSVKEKSAAPPVVAALHKIIEAEADGVKDHAELLAMEDELRAASKTLDGLLCRIGEIRKPRSVA